MRLTDHRAFRSTEISLPTAVMRPVTAVIAAIRSEVRRSFDGSGARFRMWRFMARSVTMHACVIVTRSGTPSAAAMTAT